MSNVPSLVDSYVKHLSSKVDYLEAFLAYKWSPEHWFQAEFVFVTDPSASREMPEFRKAPNRRRPFDLMIDNSDLVEMKAFVMVPGKRQVEYEWEDERSIPRDIEKLRELGEGYRKWILVIFFPVSNKDWMARTSMYERSGVRLESLREVTMRGCRRLTIALYEIV